VNNDTPEPTLLCRLSLGAPLAVVGGVEACLAETQRAEEAHSGVVRQSGDAWQWARVDGGWWRRTHGGGGASWVVWIGRGECSLWWR
jgi:hypothetical protein